MFYRYIGTKMKEKNRAIPKYHPDGGKCDFFVLKWHIIVVLLVSIVIICPLF